MPALEPAPPPSAAQWKGKGKSKADTLNAWRVSQGGSRCRLSGVGTPQALADNPAQPPFPQHLLLRDALYLLQGIDGRYVRFAFREPLEQNPYLTEKGKRGDGTGFPLGKDGDAGDAAELPEEEVVGLDFVANEQTVSSVPDLFRVGAQ